MKMREPLRNPEGSSSYAATHPSRARSDRGAAFISANRRVLGWAALACGAAMMAIGGTVVVLSTL
jgi:hypothetical protein